MLNRSVRIIKNYLIFKKGQILRQIKHHHRINKSLMKLIKKKLKNIMMNV